MTQTREQRRYWAMRRQNERHSKSSRTQSSAEKVALVAMDANEYNKLKRDFPDKEIILDRSSEVQLQLFPTYEYRKSQKHVRKDS